MRPLILCLIVLTGCATPTLPASETFDRADVALTDGDRAVDVPVYVADTPERRQQGLMGVEDLPDGTGMVFLFGEEHTGGFWMKDTLIPLSIAFASSDGEVLAVLDMEPCEADPCPTYDPGVTYRTALEVEQGFFDEVGVEPGWTLRLPEET